MFVLKRRILVHLILLWMAGVLMLPARGQAAPAAGPVAAPGDVAFIGYNADNADAMAFVILGNAAAGLEIHFRDDEWNGTGWNDANEGDLTWTAPMSGTVAGTVVAINNMNSSPAASLGTAVGSLNLNTSNEVLYAYLGTVEVPTAFLAAVASDGYTAVHGEISGTGLAAGSTALDLAVVDRDADVAVYAGSRTNQTSPSTYLAQIHDLSSNWITDDGSGDQSGDGTPPDLPFDTAPFHTPTAVSLQSFQVAAGNNTANLVVSMIGLLFTVSVIAAGANARRRSKG